MTEWHLLSFSVRLSPLEGMFHAFSVVFLLHVSEGKVNTFFPVSHRRVLVAFSTGLLWAGQHTEGLDAVSENCSRYTAPYSCLSLHT